MYSNNNMKRLTYIFGITMAVMMALTVVLPAFTPNLQTAQPAVQPTTAPEATVPPPPDINTISFGQAYLHPSGLYSVAEPTGWQASVPTTTAESARATFSNTPAQSIIQVDVDKPVSDAPLTLDDVDARFTSASLASSWARYSSWSETGQRRRVNDRLVMDFVLTSNNRTYAARQEAWTDGELVYSVRVVTPENAVDALLYVLDGMINSLKINPMLMDAPFDWNAYYDQADQYIIRYPQSWVLADSAPGRPTSISGDAGVTLRLETLAAAVADADAAGEWVATVRPGTTIESVEPVTRESFEGFSVAYTTRTADGDNQSGLAVLLNGPEDKLYVANLRLPQAGVDLNSEEGRSSYGTLAELMETFYILPGLLEAPAAE